jgi:protocatechuate 3,4-dioxygenase beta subunit
MTTDLEEEVEGIALDTLTTHLYFDEEPDEEDLKKLKGLNLVGMLETEIEKEYWDIGRKRLMHERPGHPDLVYKTGTQV